MEDLLHYALGENCSCYERFEGDSDDHPGDEIIVA